MNKQIEDINTKVYAGRVKDRKTLMMNFSGGAFTALSDYFLGNGDAVIAVVYNYQTYTEGGNSILADYSERRAA